MPDGTKKISIGRDASCDLVLNDRSISRRHAELQVASDGGLQIVDLESSGGTFVLRDGKDELILKAKLKSTDSLRLGEYEITVYELMMRAQPLLDRLAAPAPPDLPSLPKGRMVRCSCGTIKKRGEPCPSCGL
jgi:pSer/pThr/pTyr-binding forkhead associated (FHA) protein